FNTLDDLAAGLYTLLSRQKEKRSQVKFGVYSNSKDKTIFIGKKGSTGVVRIMEFPTTKEAHDYLRVNQTLLEDTWNAMKNVPDERRLTNRERNGVDWRGGKNIEAQEFMDTFGFRGVEFGNWVNNSERQQHVNEAYDALMDLASVLKITPQAISLAGKLGLAFGARGSGKASAHYEPSKVVINLTKTKGSGSLAHEWWHALDSYFAKNRGQDLGFLTESPYQRTNRDGTKDESVRAEVIAAFKQVVNAVNESRLQDRSLALDKLRSKAYWSTIIEMTARSFESYVVNELEKTGQNNDYLANFKKLEDWVMDAGDSMDASKNFPYPTAEESKFIDEKFGQLFDAIQERTEGGITGVLYQGNKSSMVAKDGEFIITALTNPNVSSPIHELVHVWEHYLTADERNVVNSFAG